MSVTQKHPDNAMQYALCRQGFSNVTIICLYARIGFSPSAN